MTPKQDGTVTTQTPSEGMPSPLEAVIAAQVKGAHTEREATMTKAGQGSVTVRSGTRHGHEYRSLGTLHRRKKGIESSLVTLRSASDVFPLFQHSGTEFIYMLPIRFLAVAAH